MKRYRGVATVEIDGRPLGAPIDLVEIHRSESEIEGRRLTMTIARFEIAPESLDEWAALFEGCEWRAFHEETALARWADDGGRAVE